MNYNIRNCLFFFLLSFLSLNAQCQESRSGITSESYLNAKNTYNYTYWDNNWKTTNVSVRKFTNQTSSYNLSINYSDLSIAGLAINSSGRAPSQAFQESKFTTFSQQQPGDIDVKILKKGAVIYELDSSHPTREGVKVGQLADYGTWCNRRVIDSLNFTNNAPVYGTYTGVEFTNWHNRFRLAFQLKLRESITNGQMQLSVTMPEAYSEVFYSDGVYGFATNSDGEGFAVKGGKQAGSVTVCDNTITILTSETTLQANTQYDLSLIFYAVKDNFCGMFAGIADDGEGLTITGSQNMPDEITKVPVSFSHDEGLYFIDVQNYNMGYGNKNNLDVMQNINLEIKNTRPVNKRVRLCFYDDAHSNVTGFSSMIRNPDGDPSGIPLQITKNWHNGFPMLYSANPRSFSKEYTELIIPANTTLKFDYTRVGARWGTVFAASSHQLCVVGAGVPRGGWLQAAIGSFGENITHSPDYEYGSTNVCDFRPLLVTNQHYGGTSSEYSWTGNLGGMDFFRYDTDKGNRIYQSQVKTRFNKYGPNLAETSISSFSSDNALKMDYTFLLSRSDDFTRIYYKVKIKALKDAPFSRFDIFQLGSDQYNLLKARSVAYGDNSGILGQITPTNTKANDYTTGHIALTGKTPWLWAGDGIYTKGIEGINIHGNNSMIIRSYDASFSDSVYNTPFFRERVSSTGYSAATGENPTSYCLVPPPDITSFKAGDSIQMLLEICLLPKVADAYYGPNVNFKEALTQYGNSWEMVYREVVKNHISATSPTNVITQDYPLRVEVIENAAQVTITGGAGYIPLVFSNLTTITDPKLYRVINGNPVLIDQSYHGKDFWQAEYDVETGLYEIIYNVNHDIDGDTTTVYTYLFEAGTGEEAFSADPAEMSLSDCSVSNPINTTSLCHSPASSVLKNIALSGSASQSSTGYGGIASRAIDGNTNGAYSKNSVTHTADADQSPWWKVELDKPAKIDRIRVFNRTDECCIDRLYDFSVFVLNTSMDTVYSKRFTSPPEPSVDMNANGAVGSTVLITLNGSGVLSLAEVEIYEASSEITIIAKDMNTQTEMPGVLVSVGEILRATNANGAAAANVSAGQYNCSLYFDGYKSVNKDVFVTVDTTLSIFMIPKESFTLTMNVKDLISENTIAEVQLAINDTLVDADEEGMVSLVLEEGNYSYSLTRDGYFPFEDTISLVGDTAITVLLTPDLTAIQNTINPGIEIYPNPAGDNLHLDLADSQEIELQILSSMGQILIRKSNVSGVADLNIQHLNSGIYILKVSTQKGTYTRKFLRN